MSDMPHHYRSLGLLIRSDLDLPGMPVAEAGPPDLVITQAPSRAIPTEPPPGLRILDFEKDGQRRYSAAQDDDGYLLRFSGVCDVRVSDDLTHAVITPDPDTDPGLPRVIVAGTVVAFIMKLAGHCVLHASAVEVDGRAIAFVGHSGMGKSTLTIAACRAGGRLVAEDVLVVEPEPVPVCRPGNTDVRLRPAALSLLDGTNWSQVMTPDGRHGVRPPATTLDRVELDTIVLPRPSRRLERLEVETIDRTNAVFRLVNYPRVLGMTHPPVVQRQFQGLATIATTVPVLVAKVPWGPPFRDDLGEQLLGMMQGRAARSPG